MLGAIMRAFRKPWLLFVVAVSCGGAVTAPRPRSAPPDPARSKAAGAGYFATALPHGEKPPSNEKGEPVKPKVSDKFRGVPTSNKWWSSLIWEYDPGKKTNPYSENLFPHPLALHAEAKGLGVSYPTEPVASARSYFFPYSQELLVGVEGLDAPDTRVDSYSDWAVTASWNGKGKSLSATFGHGFPFVYFTTAGGAASIDLDAGANVWSDQNGVLGLTVKGHHYGVFAPQGSAWTKTGKHLSSTLNTKNFFSVAVLPDNNPETLELYRRHAYAFVTDTRVEWKYDKPSAKVNTTFTVTSVLKEEGPGNVNTPLLALYRHQWLHTNAALSKYTYVSPRGAMKVLEGSTFSTSTTFHGVVPVLPMTANTDKDELVDFIREIAHSDELFGPGMEGKKDSYWTGKSLEKIASLSLLSDQAGDTKVRARFVQELKNELEDWFDGREPYLFYYDANWRTLIGLPSAYKSGWQMNDHHFHYGYFTFAAAIVAQYDPAWAKDARYGAMVNLLIKDAANWDRSDTRFPFLRYFDPYAGHSWANGPQLFAEGNNEESSSEEMNFNAALVLWGTATGNDAVRDLGVYLYATEVDAVEQYWFDVDKQVFPKSFPREAVGMVWGSGGKYDTWWDQNPVFVHGINFLPVTGASLYLGQRPDYVRRNYEHMVKSNKGDALIWRDIVWMYLSFLDAKRAEDLFAKDSYFEPEFGNSLAQVYHFIHGMVALGQVDTSVTADCATYAVFKKGGVRSYVTYNPAATPLKVTFSDGTVVSAAPRAISTATGKAKNVAAR
jgi:endoglucanase Acf2